MTRYEIVRRYDQARRLLSLGFTPDEADTLRRASCTLSRWHERVCGNKHGSILRGHYDRDTLTFREDDNGAPYWEYYQVVPPDYRPGYVRVPDRERGARQRIQRVIDARNAREASPVRAYIQGDPRGCALYLLRVGDVPEGASDHAYYPRGVAIF